MENEIFGLPNRIVAELGAEIMESEEVCKFLHYTDFIEPTDILSLPPVSNAPQHILNKRLFVGRRIPVVLNKVGAFMYIDFHSLYDHSTQATPLKVVVVQCNIIAHHTCMNTRNGSRLVALMCGVNDAIDGKSLSGVGVCKVRRCEPITGLSVDYSGISIKIEVEGFKHSRLGGIC